MPRYSFDLEDRVLVRDEQGADLPNDHAARQEATLRSLNGAGHQLEQYRGYHSIVVRNDLGQEVYRTKIKRA